MPTSAKTHLEMRQCVCILCWRKPKNLRNITAPVRELLELHVLPADDDRWRWLPTVICLGCATDLRKLRSDPNYTINMVEYDDLVEPMPDRIKTRTETIMQCNCSMCSVGRLKAGKYIKYNLSMSEPPGRPRLLDPAPEPSPITVCSVCFSQYGRGQYHECSKSSKVNNLQSFVRDNSTKSRQRVLSGQLKEVFAEQGVSTSGGTATLATGGKPLQATLGAKQKPGPFFSQDAMNHLQVKLGVSDRKMLATANFLRVHCGRDSVKDLGAQLTKRNHLLRNFFTSKMIPQKKYVTEIEEEGKKKKTKVLEDVMKPAVFATDTQDLAGKIMMERNLRPEDCIIQVGIDDGQNMIKVMMTIKEKEVVPDEKGKKAKYREGYCPGEFKNSGVKKLIVLFVSPTCERHDNISTILKELGLEAIDFAYSADLKMLLIICGKQAASCKHCCPFCDGTSPWLKKSKALTIGSLWSSYNDFVANGSILKTAMKFGNVVNIPLVTGPDDKLLIDLFNFPELHVLTGIVGKIIKEMERKVFPSAEEGKEFLDRWMEQPSINISRTVYHGSASFKGNMAKKLLKLSTNLTKFVDQELDIQDAGKAAPFLKALSQFNLVVDACFGQELDSNYTTLIREFMMTYRSLGISVPLKVHLLESHLEQFLVSKGGKKGAGYWSEQAMEACHYDLNNEWETVKVDEKNPLYLPKLKDTIVRYNGKHI